MKIIDWLLPPVLNGSLTRQENKYLRNYNRDCSLLQCFWGSCLQKKSPEIGAVFFFPVFVSFVFSFVSTSSFTLISLFLAAFYIPSSSEVWFLIIAFANKTWFKSKQLHFGVDASRFSVRATWIANRENSKINCIAF